MVGSLAVAQSSPLNPLLMAADTTKTWQTLRSYLDCVNIPIDISGYCKPLQSFLCLSYRYVVVETKTCTVSSPKHVFI